MATLQRPRTNPKIDPIRFSRPPGLRTWGLPLSAGFVHGPRRGADAEGRRGEREQGRSIVRRPLEGQRRCEAGELRPVPDRTVQRPRLGAARPNSNDPTATTTSSSGRSRSTTPTAPLRPAGSISTSAMPLCWRRSRESRPSLLASSTCCPQAMISPGKNLPQSAGKRRSDLMVCPMPALNKRFKTYTLTPDNVAQKHGAE